MGDPEDFRSGFRVRLAAAEAALVQGDVEPRLALWSRRDPVSLFGAWGPNKTGWDELERMFRWVAWRLGRGTYTDSRFDVEVADVSADGRMAYSVGFERSRPGAGGRREETLDRPRDAHLPLGGRRLERRPPARGSGAGRREPASGCMTRWSDTVRPAGEGDEAWV